MSQLSAFSILGDSNVKRNMVASTTNGRPLHAGAQILPCGRLSLLSATLEKVRAESDSVVLACITNFITGSFSSESSTTSRVEAIFDSFFSKVVSFCHSRPTTFVFVCSPMYRACPIWYRDDLPSILSRFSKKFSMLPDRPHNLLQLPSFDRVVLEADGVHLTPISGLEYILHLFDAAQDLHSALQLPPDAQLRRSDANQRAVEDRVLFLEQDHARLNRKLELQAAATAESLDHQENVRNETFLMMQGLPRLPKMDSKLWHQRALSDVNKVITTLGFEPVADYIQNSTGRSNDARVLYKVHIKTPELSRAIRDKFALFFAGGKDARPESLASISIRNCLTPATLGRIAILQLLGKRYRESNVGAKFQVVTYEPRPLLKLTPPPGASDRRVQTYNFMEAVSKLPVNFSKSELDDLLKRISPRCHGNLQTLFIVVSDDMLKRKEYKSKKKNPPPVSSPGSSDSSSFRTPSGSGSSATRKRGRSGSNAGPASKK